MGLFFSKRILNEHKKKSSPVLVKHITYEDVFEQFQDLSYLVGDTTISIYAFSLIKKMKKSMFYKFGCTLRVLWIVAFCISDKFLYDHPIRYGNWLILSNVSEETFCACEFEFLSYLNFNIFVHADEFNASLNFINTTGLGVKRV